MAKRLIEYLQKLTGWHRTANRQESLNTYLVNEQVSSNEFLIALARLNFVKPETLVREARNTQANAEYIVKMSETKKENI